MNKLFTVVEKSYSSIEVMKSTFISFLYPLSNENEVNDILKELRNEYPKARHICYAYIFNNLIKYSDDGEPSGTAGKPLYNLLLNCNLTNCMICVVRIFGGVLLGSSRLLRTYVSSAKSAIDKAKTYEIREEYLINVSVVLRDVSIIKGYLNKNKYEIKNVIYDEISSIEFYSKEDVSSKIKDLFYGIIIDVKLNKEIRLKEVPYE